MSTTHELKTCGLGRAQVDQPKHFVCYVRGEYIGTKECLFEFLALRSVIKQFCEVGTVLLTYKTSL